MKAVLDSNILIEFFRNPSARADFESRAGRPSLYMNSVVIMELFAGCRTEAHERALEGFLRPFRKTGRIVTPDSAAYEEAGRALSRLARSGIGAAHRRALVNDLLIAVSAYHGGLVVVTSNEKDFRLLEKHTPMRWLSAS